MRRSILHLALLPAIAALVAGAAPASAQAPPLVVDLNRLEDRDGACRLHFVFTNPADRVFERLTLDLVLFDADGVIAERVALEAAPLLADKTMVKQFDIAGRPCADIGRVLINDVTACADRSGPADGCLGLIEPRATGGAELFL
jgi:hypothetical protein